MDRSIGEAPGTNCGDELWNSKQRFDIFLFSFKETIELKKINKNDIVYIGKVICLFVSIFKDPMLRPGI